MLVRVLACAIAMLGIASPAMAGERYSAAPDVLRLLLQDESATFGSRAPLTALAPGFDAAPRIAALGPLPDTLARFEAMTTPGTATLTTEAFIMRQSDLSGPPNDSAGLFQARRVVDAVMADYPRPHRRRGMFDTMVTLRLDGEETTQSVSIGGLAGAVWGARTLAYRR